jgi:hypothetical protein
MGKFNIFKNMPEGILRLEIPDGKNVVNRRFSLTEGIIK